MDLRIQAWTRPGANPYQVKIADLPVSDAGITRGFSGVGSGTMRLPKTYSRLDELLYTDPVTPANGLWSTIRVFDGAQWIYDWLPSPRIPAQDKTDPDTEVSGDGIETILRFGQVEPFDWDGSVEHVSTFPDWIYGGRNLISNPGFEDSVCRPEVEQIIITATSGSFFLQLGADSTISLDVTTLTAFILETELEAFTTQIDDVLVTGTGTEEDPYVIEAITPCTWTNAPMTVIEDPGDPWVGGSVDLDRTQFGALQPNPWTKSQTISSGTPRIFGGYDSFRVTTAQAHTGTFSLLIDPAPIGRRYAGAQQVFRTKPGGVYQASVWVFTASASQTYRLVIRGIDEDVMSDTSGNTAVTQVTPAANTWTQLTIPNVVAEDDQIIFRIANINISGNPAIFYVDDGEFNEGAPPATVGLMFGDLYDAWTDPTLRTPIVWDDGTATDTPYLTLDFSDTIDSDGVAWADTHSLTFRPRMTGLQVLAEFVRLGYEWRVVPDSITLGTYLLQLYNPQALGEVEAAGIVGGAADIRHDARYFSPSGTALTIQAAGQLTARAQNAGLVTAFGRIEASALNLEITSSADALGAATEGVGKFNRGAESLAYTIRPQAGQQRPFIDYDPGDIITVSDPGVIDDQRRVAQVELAWSAQGAEYTVFLGSTALIGQANTNNMVNILWEQFKRADEVPVSEAVAITGGGGMMTVAVAAANASATSQAKADIVCSGVNDHVQIMEAMAICYAAGGGTVWLSEGDFEIAGDQLIVGYSIAYPEPIILRGLGYGTTIHFDGFTNFAVWVAEDCAIKECNVFPSGVG